VTRYEAANLTCLGLLMAGAVGGAIAAGWPWWAVLLVAIGAFFGGGLLVERLAPGSRLLNWLGLGWGSRAKPPDQDGNR
jgi:hypothetical protein